MDSQKHYSWPSIGQFRQTIRSVTDGARFIGRAEDGSPLFDGTKPLPTLRFVGTVKLHGTNAAIGFNRELGTTWFQSRERVITPSSDNMGFANKFYRADLEFLRSHFPDGNKIIVFGEWCGQGVQNTVAIGRLSKRFVVFGAKVDDVWQSYDVVAKIPTNHELGVYNIYDYHTEEMDIDFGAPELSQNKLVELTTKISDKCPVAAAMGSEGLGEGIVWRCVVHGWDDPGYSFKVKDERHAKGSGKVKVLAEIDVQAVENAKEFAALVVTEMRCRQGIDKMRERGLKIEKAVLGPFLGWVFDDVIKEEMDIAIESNVDLQKAKGHIGKLAREWFFKNESELVD